MADTGLSPGSRADKAAEQIFLFLQGPHGVFFPRLGAALAALGHGVLRINFNGGDAAIWPDGHSYRRTPLGWRSHVRRFMQRHRVTDLVLYGDARPLHVAAIAEARAAGVTVHVFEEGYLRPDWVTLEREGVNGYSTLPRDPAWYRAAARDLPPLASYPPLPTLKAQREWAALFYYLDIVLQHWRFPFYVSHRSVNPVREALAFLRRLANDDRHRRRSAAETRRLVGKHYVLFPLQLDTDYQIIRHSPFANMGAAVEHVMSSFTRSAPADMFLVVKEHPLDVGVRNWRSTVERAARAMAVADRVVFIEQGDLGGLVDAADALVTVNSTSGALALAAGKPVLALGSAVYGIADITDQQDIDTFWATPTPPDAETYAAFCRVLGDRCLLHGAFLSSLAMPDLIDQSIARLVDGRTVSRATG